MLYKIPYITQKIQYFLVLNSGKPSKTSFFMVK